MICKVEYENEELSDLSLEKGGCGQKIHYECLLTKCLQITNNTMDDSILAEQIKCPDCSKHIPI